MAKGHVQRVLAVVINRIDAVIPRHAAGEELVELFERDGDSLEGLARPRGGKQFSTARETAAVELT
jgi:hypothetical protein